MRRLALTLLAAVLMQAIGYCQPQAGSEPRKNVLILNSYHQGFKWTDEQTQGVVDAMSSRQSQIKFYIAYMDTKWSFDKDYFRLLHETYRVKFKHIRFDAIVATDNDAFNFLRLYRNDTFGEVPVVFCGVNWFKPEDLQGQTRYTGVNEDADIAANLDLMVRLHPAVKHIYIVVDTTTTGQIVHRKVLDQASTYKGRVAIHLLDDLGMPEILSMVSKLGSDSLVFLTIYQQDRSGHFFEYSEIASLLSKHSAVPVYGLWDFYLGHGIVGGKLTSGKAQGTSAGGLALRILAGESPETIPIIMDSPNRHLFDYQQLKRFELSDIELPPGSRVINEPPRFYTLNKSLFWGLVTGLSGLAAGMVALLFYLHVRHKAEEDLRRSEERYHSLVDNLTLGIYRVGGDEGGRFLQANPAMARMFGFDSPEELLEVPISSLYQRSEERPQFLKEIQGHGFVKNRELLMCKKDGQPVWVSINAKSHRDETGRLLWIDGIFEDITEKKHLETLLHQSQKMEAIGTLAGGVAHDFNNILTVIIGYGNLLKRGLAPDSQAMKHLAHLLSASEKAAELTRSLLAFSRKQIISPKKADLNEIVDGMGKLLFRVIGEDIELSFDAIPQALPILVDVGQIEQVLLNLVTNARDAMPHGGLLCIGTEHTRLTGEQMIRHDYATPGDYAVLTVSDNGLGMTEEVKQRIFEPFFSTKAIGKGTGLGLSILYGIVKQHEGDISVYSEPGIGTTFKIYLPIVPHDGPERVEDALAPALGGSETILVAEDNDEVRRLAQEVLSTAGYRVLLALDGDEAVLKFREHAEEIDLILLDVVMPRMNGKEVYDTIMAIKPGVRALFMSGYTADIINQKGILEERIHYISKPLSPDTLLRKVREVLSA